MNRRVVVTGLGAISPLGLTVPQLWEGLLAGRSGTGLITKFDASGFPSRVAAEIKNYHPANYFEPKEARRIDVSHQYALVAAKEAFGDAGLTSQDYDPIRAGTIIGCTNGGITTLLSQYELYRQEGSRHLSPFLLQMMFCDMMPSLVSIKYNLQNASYTTVSACSSGANAIGDSYRLIQRGDADIMITGGTESSIVPFAIAGFCKIKAMSTRNDQPGKASRPFDKNRDGFVLGEGSAIMILEELEHAKCRGAKIYAEIVGYGMSSDAYHWTAPDPEGSGASLLMQATLNDAGLEPTDIDYINSHGTSTLLGDIAETKAVKRTFGEHAFKLTINASKSAIGHLLGAAGAIEALICTLSIRDNKIHPTINYETQDPECDLDYSPNRVTERKINFALTDSLGFGGHNVALILKKYRP